MQINKTVNLADVAVDSNPLTRLVEMLKQEGFTTENEDEDWQKYGEKVYRRNEKVLLIRGETAFVLIDFPLLDEKTLQRAMEGITNVFRAKNARDKALSIFQPTTVYVCIVARNESPHNTSLNRYITTVGGAVLIPVIIVPEINQVVYPSIEERIGSVKPRVQYLQYILGERRDPANMHRQTVQTFYISAALLFVLIAGVVATMLS